ncbi:MAG: ribonuclease HII [Candidatus Hydrogenedentes bacterium]|nr:ribonuclease HII [Candidatus Hydrogenedentota bacterium]
MVCWWAEEVCLWGGQVPPPFFDGAPTVRRTLRELRETVSAGPPYDAAVMAALAQDERAGARRLHAACLRRIERARAQDARMAAMMRFEEEARQNGFRRIAGVDEAGRGPLAGPIVAAAVVLAHPIPGLNDSKQLTAEQRESLFACLHQDGHAVAKAIISAEQIDQWGIQSANYGAMARAVALLEPAPDFLLVDGFTIPGCIVPHRRIVKGDRRSQSIAAASVIAKVIRDRIMIQLDRQYPGYGFAQHKGYGTQEHIDAIRRLGPCPAHRKSFAPIAETADTGLLFQSGGKEPNE